MSGYVPTDLGERVLAVLADAPDEGLRSSAILDRLDPAIEPQPPARRTAFSGSGAPWEILGRELSALWRAGLVREHRNAPWPRPGGWVGHTLTDAGRAHVAEAVTS